MTRKAEPCVIDFTNVHRIYDREHYKVTPEQEATNQDEYQAILTALRGGRPGLNAFVPGRVYDHTTVPEFRMRRARRILWQCKQQPQWQRTQAAFFKHRSLKNVPYVVLKQLVKESETNDA